jgi:hypothetical protein
VADTKWLILEERRWLHCHQALAQGDPDWRNHTCPGCSEPEPPHDCKARGCDFVTEGDMFGNKTEVVTFHAPAPVVKE